jgi:hypothetical protein
MVKHGYSGIWPVYFAARKAQTGKGLWGSHLMYQVTVDIENGGLPRRFTHGVAVPDFLKHGFWYRGI